MTPLRLMAVLSVPFIIYAFICLQRALPYSSSQALLSNVVVPKIISVLLTTVFQSLLNLTATALRSADPQVRHILHRLYSGNADH